MRNLQLLIKNNIMPRLGTGERKQLKLTKIPKVKSKTWNVKYVKMMTKST